MIPEERRGDPEAYAEYMATEMGRPARLRAHHATFVRSPLDDTERQIVCTVIDLEPIPGMGTQKGRRFLHEQRVGLFIDGHSVYSGIVNSGFEERTS